VVWNVWNHGIVNDFPIILGISSSQLTNSIIFQRGRLKPTTSSLWYQWGLSTHQLSLSHFFAGYLSDWPCFFCILTGINLGYAYAQPTQLRSFICCCAYGWPCAPGLWFLWTHSHPGNRSKQETTNDTSQIVHPTEDLGSHIIISIYIYYIYIFFIIYIYHIYISHWTYCDEHHGEVPPTPVAFPPNFARESPCSVWNTRIPWPFFPAVGESYQKISAKISMGYIYIWI